MYADLVIQVIQEHRSRERHRKWEKLCWWEKLLFLIFLKKCIFKVDNIKTGLIRIFPNKLLMIMMLPGFMFGVKMLFFYNISFNLLDWDFDFLLADIEDLEVSHFSMVLTHLTNISQMVLI